MNLNDVSLEIRDLMEKRRDELNLSFIEEEHIYYMMDTDGVLKKNFPSVSKVVRKFHKHFDSEGKALQMANGDPEGQQKLLSEWKAAGDYSTNMGSRVHYVLETDTISRFGSYKEVRQPIFNCDETQITKSDSMIIAGKKYLDLMNERGAILLDTESILGDPELGYTGQPDKLWLMMNKEKTDFGFVITDWKTNQPKNFEPQYYTKKMYHPFNSYDDTALGHYYLQLPLYGKLVIKMLQGTKYESIKMLGCVVVLLKDDETFQEYKVPGYVNNTILNMDIKKYLTK
jgi:hypothetical protein